MRSGSSGWVRVRWFQVPSASPSRTARRCAAARSTRAWRTCSDVSLVTVAVVTVILLSGLRQQLLAELCLVVLAELGPRDLLDHHQPLRVRLDRHLPLGEEGDDHV